MALAITSEELFQWALVFFLFMLPGLGRIFGKREEEGAPRPRRDRSTVERPDVPDFDDSDDVWGRLLRGEPVEPVEPVEPEARPRPVPREIPAPIPVPPIARKSVASPGSKAFEPLERSSMGSGARSDVSPSFEDSLLRGSTFRSQEAFQSITDLVSDAITETAIESAAWAPDAPDAPTSPDGDRAYDIVTTALPLTGTDWRHAMVLREVLGQPVALRSSADPDLPSFH